MHYMIVVSLEMSDEPKMRCYLCKNINNFRKKKFVSIYSCIFAT